MTDKKSQVALKAFFNLTKEWELNSDQQVNLLGLPLEQSLINYKNDKEISLSKEKLERISYLLGIYKCLHTVFTNKKQANTWIHHSNRDTLFQGKSALDFMTKGGRQNLKKVRTYLESQYLCQ